MIIDSHQHVMLPSHKQVEKLDHAGIDKAILFCTTPHPERVDTYEELKQEMDTLYQILQGANTKEDSMHRLQENIQEMVQVLKTYPDRFYGFGAVPFGLTVQENVSWIQEHVICHDLKGIGEFTPGNNQQIKQLESVFLALEQIKPLPIWVHTFDPVSLEGLKILMDLTQKHTSIPVIFGHMGGSHWQTVLEFAWHTPNAYIDLSASFSTLAVKMMMKALPDRCLFSSDEPYGDTLLSKQMIESISPSLKITQKVLGENIQKLLGIDSN